ncbi:hypothetical protein [Sphingomonas parapaucimobilis]|uniref:Uncharacterized protein n=1 Tax=Sphingomonas parapaucimobilis NBRC 15100 TaxID=1219049 RepID=A0A0A1WAF2_9SPHN|nr:hypothetical protein [Sphingomonas parapaucimobilis]GAM01909.1 hypothetical protein SP5_069_01530 [Sphingomonas parapaucimobilis NBRC 15100]
MTTIYTATATNSGFFMALATAADSADAARATFLASDLMNAPADEGGAYTLADDLTARVADEDGDIDLGVTSYIGDPADILAAPGTVELLQSGVA